MANLKVTIVDKEDQTLYGLWKKSNDKSISRDIGILSEEYHGAVSIPEGGVLPFFVLYRNYDEQSKNFELFIGSEIAGKGLEAYVLPDGEYAKITVKPKFGLLWSASIGEAKRFFYSKWLWDKPYEALNMEYEYHTEKSKGKKPSIDLMFALKRKR